MGPYIARFLSRDSTREDFKAGTRVLEDMGDENPEVSMAEEIQTVDELRDALKKYTAERGSEDAKDAIHNSETTHTSEVWEDGEITFMKNGDLWRHRNMHQSVPPFLQEEDHLWDVPEGRDHISRIVTDNRAKELIQEFRENQYQQRSVEFKVTVGVGFTRDDDHAVEKALEKLEDEDTDSLMRRIQRYDPEVTRYD